LHPGESNLQITLEVGKNSFTQHLSFSIEQDNDPIPSFIYHHPYPHLKTLEHEVVERVVVEDTARLTELTVGSRSLHHVYWLDDKG